MLGFCVKNVPSLFNMESDSASPASAWECDDDLLPKASLSKPYLLDATVAVFLLAALPATHFVSKDEMSRTERKRDLWEKKLFIIELLK